MRRRSRRCHLSNIPAAETSYSAAGLIKYSRVRVPSDDYGFDNLRPGMIASTPTACLMNNASEHATPVPLTSTVAAEDGSRIAVNVWGQHHGK